MPEQMLEDPDARLGGNDTLLEKLNVKTEARLEEARKGTTMYEVQILANPDGASSWRVLGRMRGTSGRDAMRQLADQAHKGDVLRAIPTRNITELTLDVETTTRVKLS